ncbi:Competence protein [Pseudoalteromonas sp. 3J6]|mgnify:FL=1|jgi:competence protein ComEA|uniref:ComEA family DNA-binding protein n=1 Tax=unclassified Pseudoalteromonas TaxID=194690 RepID=UPI00110A2191|nr:MULTISPECIES: ComEA family DNA-binding protein [unclassified Pseudoalteromonas]MDN3485342.1 ComEA family DNA-binding protein [Pseudoalteromonas sp. APC 3224]NWL16944.1 ComEA family DNA-binding protein [Pseudoalteromonas sp. Scap03]QLE82045.1 ComEA family DNA-binding protein [Pseudoalteromonas sp. Scap25]QLE89988.1 ComEA family DNA-binding protein [Pseudoalteromonas sp. Scap06]TMP72655.1 competence protein [Pseudoalteromonas sp. S1609]
MKLIKIISLAAALCLLPMGTTFAQSDMLSEQMQSAMVNINSADLKQLIKLPGVGKKKAQAIIDYREANGDFASLEDLAKVKGVGKKMLAKLDGKVTF